MQVTKIVNRYRTANTFILDSGMKSVVLIDVGGPDLNDLTTWLSQNQKSVAAVLLTHEHADHCLGVNELHQYFPFQLYCSKRCSDNIGNSKQNFSRYTDEIPTFEVTVPANILADGVTIDINGLRFHTIETPGHSPGGMCFLVSGSIFTGDTLLQYNIPPLSFPHSNKDEYKKSLEKLLPVLRQGIPVFPGHGDPFGFSTLPSTKAALRP